VTFEGQQDVGEREREASARPILSTGEICRKESSSFFSPTERHCGEGISAGIPHTVEKKGEASLDEKAVPSKLFFHSAWEKWRLDNKYLLAKEGREPVSPLHWLHFALKGKLICRRYAHAGGVP